MLSLAGGDDRAMRELVDLWQAPLLRFCHRYLQNESEARDVVQDVFVRLYSKLEHFDHSKPLSPWLFMLAVNLCRNRRRWLGRHRLLSLDWLLGTEGPGVPLACPRLPPDRDAEASERVRQIRAAIEELPHEMKTTLLLHEYENLGYREIAQVLGCSEKGVESRLARARKSLRLHLAGLLAEKSTPEPDGRGVLAKRPRIPSLGG